MRFPRKWAKLRLVSNDNLAHHARKNGVFLITQQGKHIVISDSNVAPIG